MYLQQSCFKQFETPDFKFWSSTLLLLTKILLIFSNALQNLISQKNLCAALLPNAVKASLQCPSKMAIWLIYWFMDKAPKSRFYWFQYEIVTFTIGHVNHWNPPPKKNAWNALENGSLHKALKTKNHISGFCWKNHIPVPCLSSQNCWVTVHKTLDATLLVV